MDMSLVQSFQSVAATIDRLDAGFVRLGSCVGRTNIPRDSKDNQILSAIVAEGDLKLFYIRY